MGVEMDHGHLAVLLVDGAQDRVGDEVVAADGDGQDAPVEELRRALLDRLHGVGDGERREDEVAAIGDFVVLEGIDLELGIVGPGAPAAVAHPARAEAGPRRADDAAVIGHAEDADVRALHVLHERRLEEGRYAREAPQVAGGDELAVPVSVEVFLARCARHRLSSSTGFAAAFLGASNPRFRQAK